MQIFENKLSWIRDPSLSLTIVFPISHLFYLPFCTLFYDPGTVKFANCMFCGVGD
jgi:hypothetical protein